MFLCENCPAYIRDIEARYACNVTPKCECAVCGERVKPVMICNAKIKLDWEKKSN